MPRKLRVLAFALPLPLLLLRPISGFAQTVGASTDATTDVVTQVIGIAPQLVAFAGSDSNFRNLVQGLSQGTPVTLTTATSDGLTQTVTFTPSGTMSATDIARTLETARQQLITRGVATPTALQIGTTLVGGSLTTAAGTAQVSPVLPQPGGMVTPSASAGATTPRLGAANTASSSNLTVNTQPTTVTVTTPTGLTTTGTIGSTTTGTTASGSTTTGTTGITNNNGTFVAPNPIFSSTPAPATTNPNGNPAPAVQMQGRR